tara:strand:+ start:30793 stop:31929 length:1137 start_codon:yes stop_codon:yes gene_type:complete
MSEEQKKYALDHYEAGFTNKTLLAKMMIEKWKIDMPVEKLRRSLSSWLNRNAIKKENPALSEECETVGIDPNDVRHAWYKGEHWSINFKPSSSGPTFDEMLKEHIEDVKNHTFNYKPIVRERYPDSCLLVIDPADVHIGKLARSFETGEEYNSQIAVQRVKDGVQGILDKTAGFNIDKILFIAGNDIMHVDTPKRVTTSGTPQDTDGMWYDNFLLAKRLYVDVVDQLMQVADVRFMFNPSNHDYQSGFFLADSISSWFKKCKNVSFDVSIAHRKYYKYHNNLIGTTHGDGAKAQDLPLLMAQEAKKDWAEAKNRYVYIHHIHHKMSKDFIGVTVEALRSPSGTDSWHHRNGYQHSPKAVEGFVHSKDHGQIARITHLF